MNILFLVGGRQGGGEDEFSEGKLKWQIKRKEIRDLFKEIQKLVSQFHFHFGVVLCVLLKSCDFSLLVSGLPDPCFQSSPPVCLHSDHYLALLRPAWLKPHRHLPYINESLPTCSNQITFIPISISFLFLNFSAF